MEVLNKFIMPGIILVLTLASGIWLTGAGKPLNGILFTLHKLIALAAVVIFSFQFVSLIKNTPVQAILIGLFGLCILSVLTLFFTGAMMSAGKLSYALMLTIHRVVPILLAIFLGLTIYLLNGRTI